MSCLLLLQKKKLSPRQNQRWMFIPKVLERNSYLIAFTLTGFHWCYRGEQVIKSRKEKAETISGWQAALLSETVESGEIFYLVFRCTAREQFGNILIEEGKFIKDWRFSGWPYPETSEGLQWAFTGQAVLAGCEGYYHGKRFICPQRVFSFFKAMFPIAYAI